VAEVHHKVLCERTLRHLEILVVIMEPSQYLSEMINMFLQSFTIYKDIFEEDEDKFTEPWRQGAVHGTLECTGCTCESKCHDMKLILSQVSLEGYLMFIPMLQQYLMEFGSQI
jgi:hypothetical protein